MLYWEIIADQIAKAGWSYGYNKYLTDDNESGEVRVVFVADAHRSDGHRFVSQAETLMTAFIELQKMLGNVDANREDGHRYVSQAETLLSAFLELRKTVAVVDDALVTAPLGTTNQL